MTSSNSSLSLRARMLIGAIVGLLVISYFLISAGAGDPAWGKYWRIRPLIMVPFAGAMAGLCNFLILRYRFIVGINKAIAIVISVLVSIVGLWMGIVLGLNGTLWN